MSSLPYVGFGTLEELAEDLRADGCERLRADHIILPSRAGQHGMSLDRMGVMVSTQVNGEIRYAWVIVGSRQRAYNQVFSGEDVPARTEAAYQRIVHWLGERGFEVRPGSYSFPVDLRMMQATADVLRSMHEEEE